MTTAPLLTPEQLDGLARGRSGIVDHRPLLERQQAHLARVRTLRRVYHRWFFLVATPGIVLFSISVLGLLGRSAGERTPLFVTRPALATVLFVAGVALGVLGCLMAGRRGVLLRHHHRLLVEMGVHPDNTRSPVR